MKFADGYKTMPANLELHLASYLRNEFRLLHWIMAFAPQRVLEVGAGTGRACILTKRLLPAAWVTAVDIDNEVVETIREKAQACGVGMDVWQADVRSLPYADLHFDLCFSSGLMEHFNREDFIKGMKEQLRVARMVLVQVPTMYWFIAEYSRQGDELIWPPMTWLTMLNKVGTILNFTLIGPPQEEILLLAAMTTTPGVSLSVTENVEIIMGKDEDGQA